MTGPKTKEQIITDREREILATCRAWRRLEEAEDAALVDGNWRALTQHRNAIASVQDQILSLVGYLPPGRKPR